MANQKAVGRTSLAVALVCLAGAAPARAEKITLDEALKRAAKDNPDLQAAGAEVEVSAGVLLGARKLPYNPELDARLGPAFGGGQTLFEYEVGLSQTLELGGQRKRRTAAAEARRGAADARERWARYLTALRVRRAYFLALVTRARLETTRDAETVAAELKAAAVERISLGAGTQLEVNVGTAAVGRAQAERMAAERRYREARAELASIIGAAPDADLEPEGQVPRFETPALTEEEYVERALKREDVAALGLERDATQADLALAEALAVPDLSLGVTYGRDAVDSTNAVLLGLSMPIPIFNRNQGGQAAARGALRRTTILADVGRREAEREARTAFRNYSLARDAVSGFDRDVIEKLGENLGLARESFRAGKIGLLEFNVVRRDLVDTRLAYLDALAQLVDAWFALEAAAGGSVGVSP
ncbi:MAG: TolC family protein [Deltaproteobacteria bacterium]|nr:TolC family protein [Deltaproteobacteria bacterium]